jgi:hypothetical protein
VHVSAPGYFDRDEDAIATQGIASIVPIVLEPKPGRLAITTPPGARITVDGRGVGTRVEVPAGRHIVTIEQRGHEPAVREVGVGNDQQVAVDVPLVETARRRAVPRVLEGAAVAGGACLLTALAAYYYQHEARDIYDQSRSGGNVSPSEIANDYDTDRSRRDGLRAAAWITGGIALATAGTAFLLYRFDDPTPDTTRVVPVATPSGAGAVVTGRW